MRLPPILLALAAGLSFPSCDGALGGAEVFPARVASDASTAGGPAGEARARPRPRPTAPRADDAPEEPVAGREPGVEAVPGTAPGTTSTPPAAAPADGAPGGGGRPGARGGSKGSKIGVELALRAPGAGAGAGTVRGRALFDGPAPERKPIPGALAASDCHADATPILEEDVVVHDGALAGVFVSIRKVPPGVAVPAPAGDPFVLDQRTCTYFPHVGAVQAGRPVVARNSDPTGHNVHLYANKNTGVNSTIQPGGADLALSLPSPEKVRLGCDIHPWMSADLYVVEHPWFDVSAVDGRFTIADLPAGTYELEATHAKLGRGRSDAFAVAGGTEVEVTFTFSGK